MDLFFNLLKYWTLYINLIQMAILSVNIEWEIAVQFLELLLF